MDRKAPLPKLPDRPRTWAEVVLDGEAPVKVPREEKGKRPLLRL